MVVVEFTISIELARAAIENSSCIVKDILSGVSSFNFPLKLHYCLYEYVKHCAVMDAKALLF